MGVAIVVACLFRSSFASCNKWPGGSCRLDACSATRGPTTCTGLSWKPGYGHKCKCQAGFCAHHGACIPEGDKFVCKKKTGGTCRFTGCHKSRHAKCVDGKCVCKGHHVCSIGGHCRDIDDIMVDSTNQLSDDEND